MSKVATPVILFDQNLLFSTRNAGMREAGWSWDPPYFLRAHQIKFKPLINSILYKVIQVFCILQCHCFWLRDCLQDFLVSLLPIDWLTPPSRVVLGTRPPTRSNICTLAFIHNIKKFHQMQIMPCLFLPDMKLWAPRQKNHIEAYLVIFSNLYITPEDGANNGN